MTSIVCNAVELHLSNLDKRKMLAIHAVIGEQTTFFSMDMLTTVTLAGGVKNPFKGRITCRKTIMCRSNADYEAMVQKRQKDEGIDPSFQSQQSNVGNHIAINGCDSPFIYNANKEDVYLTIYPMKTISKVYYLNGIETPKSDDWNFPKAANPEQGGIENKVMVQTPKLSSIVGIRANKIELTF